MPFLTGAYAKRVELTNAKRSVGTCAPKALVRKGTMATGDLLSFGGMGATTPMAREHVLAVTRNFNKQPRISMWELAVFV